MNRLWEAEEYLALYRSVVEHPESDLPRLIAADWVEENGDAEFAEFVRLQCEEAEPSSRQRVLWGRLVGRWDWWHAYRDDLHAVKHVSCGPPWTAGGNDAWVLRRGFIDEVRCGLDWWEENGPQAVRRLPLTRVALTDEDWTHWQYSEAAGTNNDWYVFSDLWHFDEVRLQQTFDSRDSATDAISKSLLGWARKQEAR